CFSASLSVLSISSLRKVNEVVLVIATMHAPRALRIFSCYGSTVCRSPGSHPRGRIAPENSGSYPCRQLSHQLKSESTFLSKQLICLPNPAQLASLPRNHRDLRIPDVATTRPCRPPHAPAHPACPGARRALPRWR